MRTLTLACTCTTATPDMPCAPVTDCGTYWTEVQGELDDLDPFSQEYEDLKACADVTWHEACGEP